MSLIAAFLFGLLSLALPLWLARRGGLFFSRQRWDAATALGLAVFFGALGFFVERGLSEWLARSTLRASTNGGVLVLLFMAPFGEAAKVLSLWHLYRRRRLVRNVTGATYAVLCAGGYAALKLGFGLATQSEGLGLLLLRSAVALPAHYFFAGLWGHMLGGERRDRHFGWVFLTCVGLHGVYEHLIFFRGPAFLVVALPMVIMMFLGVLGVRRQPHSSGRPSSLSLFQPSGVESLRGVMSTEGRPLKVQWILFGALVTLGVMFVLLGLAIFLGLKNGVDFSTVEQAGEAGVVPLSLLGAALLLAFPTSAFLIASASAAVSVLEPAWATLLAIGLASVLFSLTDTSALLIVLGIAPVGFSLACAGAWFGLSRR